MTNAEKFQEIFKEFATEVWAFPEKDFLTWLNAEYEEPTAKNDLALIHTEGLDEEIRCTMCTNSMKSDRGCDGSCVVDKDMYKAVMDAIEKRIQPTTKNDLGVDAVSRKAVLNTLDNMDSALDEDRTVETYKELLKECYKVLPSVTPQDPRCKDCKWWKDSDGEYRRGCGAESQCPMNRREVYEGNGYCFLFEPQESEDDNGTQP